MTEKGFKVIVTKSYSEDEDDFCLETFGLSNPEIKDICIGICKMIDNGQLDYDTTYDNQTEFDN